MSTIRWSLLALVLAFFLLSTAHAQYVFKSYSDGSCPPGYEYTGNGKCWYSNMKGRLEFQNKLQDDFRNDHTSDNNNGAMLHTSTHRMVITANAFSKDKSLGSSMTPLTNTIIYIQLISRHSKTQEVLMPTINGIETRHFFINRTYEFTTNALGKVILAIPTTSIENKGQKMQGGKVNVDHLHSIGEPPMLRARAEFMPRGKWIVVPMDIDYIQSLSVLTGARLASSPHIGNRKSQKQIDDAASAIASLSKSALYSRMHESENIVAGGAPRWQSSKAKSKIQNSQENSSGSSSYPNNNNYNRANIQSHRENYLSRRALPVEYHVDDTVPYDDESNHINHMFIHNVNNLKRRDGGEAQNDGIYIERVIDLGSMDFAHMEIDFRNGGFKLNKHENSESVMNAVNGHAIANSLAKVEEDDTSPSSRSSISTIFMKDTSYDNQEKEDDPALLARNHNHRLIRRGGFFHDLAHGFKTFGKAVKNGFKAFGKDVKKIGKTIIHTVKKDAKDIGHMFHEMIVDPKHMWKHFWQGITAVGQDTVKGIGQVIDVVIQSPVDIMKAVARADLVFFKPLNDLANALETYVVHPLHGVIRFVVSTVSGIIGIIGGILANIEMLPKFLWELLKAVFNWDGILRVSRFVNHHLGLMAPYSQMMIEREFSKVYQSFDDMCSLITGGCSSLPHFLSSVGVSTGSSMTSLAKAPSNLRVSNAGDMTDIVQNNNDHSLSYAHDTRTSKSGIQATYLRDMTPNVAGSLSNMPLKPKDHHSMSDIAGIIKSFITESGVEFKAMGRAFERCWNELKQKMARGLKMGDVFHFLKELFDVVLRGVFQFVALLLVKISEIMITFFDSILSYHINIPIISWLYESVLMKGTEQLTLYSLASLAAAIPVFAVGQAQSKTWENKYQDGEFFSQTDLDILLAIQDPSKYLDAWMPDDYDPNVGILNINPLLARKRNVLSYIIGSAAVESRFVSSILGSTDAFDFTGLLYILRGPFDFVNVICSYPLDWLYLGLNPKSSIHLPGFKHPISQDELRFVPWFMKLTTLVTGFLPASNNAITPFGWFILVASLVLQTAAVIAVFVRDISINNSGQLKSFTYLTDILMKAFSNILQILGKVEKQIAGPGDPFIIIGMGLDVAGATGHVARLGIDMMDESVFSV